MIEPYQPSPNRQYEPVNPPPGYPWGGGYIRVNRVNWDGQRHWVNFHLPGHGEEEIPLEEWRQHYREVGA